MKTYQVTIIYTGEEIYTLTARNEIEAEIKALHFFSRNERGNVKTPDSTYDIPQDVVTKVISETVDLPETDVKQE